MAWTEADDTAVLVGAVAVRGNAAWIESDDTAALVSAVSVNGAVVWTEANDTLAATGGNDVLTLGNGDNIVLGGMGADQITTGVGTDTIFGDNGYVQMDAEGNNFASFGTKSQASTGGLLTDLGGNDVIARTQTAHQRGRNGRHARRRGARDRRAFQQRHALFEATACEKRMQCRRKM